MAHTLLLVHRVEVNNGLDRFTNEGDNIIFVWAGHHVLELVQQRVLENPATQRHAHDRPQVPPQTESRRSDSLLVLIASSQYRHHQ